MNAVMERQAVQANEEVILGWFFENFPEVHAVYPDNGTFFPYVNDKTRLRSEVLEAFKSRNPEADICLMDPESFGLLPKTLPVGIAPDYSEEHPEVFSRPVVRIPDATGNALPKTLVEAVIKANVVRLFLGLMNAPVGTVNDRLSGPKSPTLLHLAAGMYARYVAQMRENTSTYPKGPLCARHYSAVCELLLTLGANPQLDALRPGAGRLGMPLTPMGWCDGRMPKCLRERSLRDAAENKVGWVDRKSDGSQGRWNVKH